MEPQMMSRARQKGLLSLLALIAILSLVVVLAVFELQAAPLADAPPSEPPLPYRETSGSGKSPQISFIDSPSATCHRPVAGTAACYIEWNYLYVAASSGAYIISMTVAIDQNIRAYHAGFFQSYMYIPADMTGPGYKVTCGAAVSGSSTQLGNSYSYVIRARDSDGLSAANYGSVTCPADTVNVFVPIVQKP
jgi:hypothetical protein